MFDKTFYSLSIMCNSLIELIFKNVIKVVSTCFKKVERDDDIFFLLYFYTLYTSLLNNFKLFNENAIHFPLSFKKKNPLEWRSNFVIPDSYR